MRFVTRVKEGERVTDLCLEFGISRKTGHKILARYKELGLPGLEDQRRAPKRIPHRTPTEVRDLLIETKSAHPTWGPKKLKAWLENKQVGVEMPSPSAICGWLRKAGLVKTRARRRFPPGLTSNELTKASAPNEVWCADFKGEFLLGNGEYCYPLTITDLSSRYLLACTAFDSTKAETARWGFIEAFREFGLPKVIRTDNGGPFSSVGMGGFTALSVLWLRLGIRAERIEPGHPEQNGQHERMHLTLKLETTRPAGANSLQQQERFDTFRDEFNNERPHEALGQHPPSSCYVPSERRLPDELLPPTYPLHDYTNTVSTAGTVYIRNRGFYLSHALAGERVGLREVQDGRWVVTFVNLDLGHYDERTKSFERSV